MFSTKNVFRVAALVLNKDAEEVIQQMIDHKIIEPKKVEVDIGGKFDALNSQKYIQFEKKIDGLISVMENKNIRAEGKVRIKDEDAFLERITGSLDAIEKKLNKGKAGKKDLLNLYAARELLNLKKKIIEFSQNCESAADFVIIEGWIDKKRLDELKGIVKAHISILEYVEPEDAPVLLKNIWPFSWFEEISYFYPPFKYKSIDVTPFIAVTFPLIFGIMFASVLDGLILLTISALVYYRTKMKLAGVGIFLALSSISFGFIFGEDSIFHYGGLFPVYENPINLMYLSIAIGILHITLGHLLGIANKIKLGRKKEAIPHLGVILLMAAGLSFFFLQAAFYPLLVIGLLFVIFGGAESIAELPHAFGHIISYLRIFAISIAHYSIVKAFEGLAGGFFGSLAGDITGVAILAIGHAIILTIELLIAFIHTLRLHILEFGTKFLEAGTGWLNTFKFSRSYTELIK